MNDYRKMNPLRAGALAELNFEAFMAENKGDYKRCSTFAADFAIADSFGAKAVKETFERSFGEWKHDPKMMAEMSIVLNHGIWRYHEVDPILAGVYDECWRKADDHCVSSYKGDDLDWYCMVTD